MRIVPVTGDLPALAFAPPQPVRSAADPPPATATAPVEQASATDTGAGAGARPGDHRPPSAKPFFDPPLIAQRAALGLPTGYLIAEFAESQGLSYAVVAEAVDREMPRSVD